MKKCYNFLPKNWLYFGLITAFTASFSFSTLAQTAPAKMWDKTFGGDKTDLLCSVQQTTDGGYILGGTSESGISGDKSQPQVGNSFYVTTDYWVIKVDGNGNKVWDKSFGGIDHEQLLSLQQTADGGYILGGSSQSGLGGDKSQASKGHSDYWVVKLDANGNKTWDKTIGGSNTDYLKSLQQTADGGYILGGESFSGIGGDKSQASQGDLDFWVVKLDANGNKIWDKTIGGNADDIFGKIQQTTDGGYILGGYSNSGISGDKSQALIGGNDYWVVKLNATGSKVWDKSYGGTLGEFLYALQQTSDGGYILCGYSNSPASGSKTQPSQGDYDYWVVKLDANGNKTWDKTFGGINSDEPMAVQQTADGGYLLAGSSLSGISGDKTQALKGGTDFWLVKLDGNGNKRWDASFGGSDFERLLSFQQTADSGYILGGISPSDISGDKSQDSRGGFDFWIVKLAPEVLGTKETKPTFILTLSPNPSHGRFNLHLTGLTTSTAEVTVTDLLGRTILQQQFNTTNAQLSEEITLPAAATGMYLLQVNAGEKTTSRKIVVE